MKITGGLIDAEEHKNGTILRVKVEENLLPLLQRQKTRWVDIGIDDGRMITKEQRKKAYATINDISAWTGHEPEYLKEHFKYRLMAEKGWEYFSLSNCSISEAREYISTLIDFCLDWEIPIGVNAMERVEDVERYLYRCLITRTCCISGEPNADIHHVGGSRVGMGRNRKKISHEGLKLIALSRRYHTLVHSKGEEELFKRFKVYGISIDREGLKALGLKVDDID